MEVDCRYDGKEIDLRETLRRFISPEKSISKGVFLVCDDSNPADKKYFLVSEDKLKKDEPLDK